MGPIGLGKVCFMWNLCLEGFGEGLGVVDVVGFVLV